MARIKNTAYPVNVFSKYTLKQLRDKIKNYNIPNYTKMKKQELTEYLNQRFNLQNEMLVLKGFISPAMDLSFDPNLFSDNFKPETFAPKIFSDEFNANAVLPVAKKSGNRKQYLPNRKIMPPKKRGRPVGSVNKPK
jgi:hypothetical protein